MIVMELIKNWGFKIDKYKDNGYVVLEKYCGSLSNGVNIKVEYFGNLIHRPEFGEEFVDVRIKGKKWTFDGDEYEVEQNFDFMVKDSKVLEVLEFIKQV